VSDNRAVGVFDSGLGGLTAVRELTRLLPQEEIVYFGDTAACHMARARGRRFCLTCDRTSRF
jgi:glutamate racemase